LALFALLSGADFLLTWHLLRDGAGAAYEGNPLAAWWLARAGWVGLAAFKAAMTLTAAGLAVLVFRRRPRAGHRLLAFCCAAVAAVVLYSSGLCGAAHRTAAADAEALASLASEADRLEAARQRCQDYRAVLRDVARDLRAGRCTLGEGVERLAATELAHDANWLRGAQCCYPGLSARECVAVSVLNDLAPAADAPGELALWRTLHAQFRALYGRGVPSAARASVVRWEGYGRRRAPDEGPSRQHVRTPVSVNCSPALPGHSR
jgi:hypothetical protein